MIVILQFTRFLAAAMLGAQYREISGDNDDDVRATGIRHSITKPTNN